MAAAADAACFAHILPHHAASTTHPPTTDTSNPATQPHEATPTPIAQPITTAALATSAGPSSTGTPQQAVSAVSTQTTMPSVIAYHDAAVDMRVRAPPLVVMHDVVANVATRLALLRCYQEAQALAEGGWGGGLRVGERGALHASQRCVIGWVGVFVLLLLLLLLLFLRMLVGIVSCVFWGVYMLILLSFP